MRFQTNASEAMRIDSSGNVAIGNTSAGAKLDIRQDSGTAIRCEDGSGGYFVVQHGGSVGIGTSSPASNRLLHVSSSPQNQARFERTGASTVQIEFHDSTTTNQPSLGGDGDNLTFRTSFAERMRLDASGNLLVGKTSAGSSNVGVELRPQGYIFGTGDGINPLRLNRKTSDGMIADFQKDGTTVGSIGAVAGDIVIGTGACGIRFHDGTPALQPRNTDGSANNDAIDIGLNGNRFKNLYLSNTVNVGSNTTISPDGSNGQIKQASGVLYYKSGQHNFQNAAGTSEYARFDTSGNLLVSKTSNDNSTAGVVLRDTGEGSFVASGQRSGLFNRLSSDGDIVEFRRDSTTVGNIGTDSSGVIYMGGNTKIKSGTAAIIPTNNDGTTANGTKDLGFNNGRWNNLYLAGGVYLGGTGSANHLDDYEEGTWTPAVTNAATGSVVYSAQNGHYVKVGKFVSATFYLVFTKGTLSGGALRFTGLPFTVDSLTNMYPQAAILIDNLEAPLSNPLLQITTGQTTGVFIEGNGSTGNHDGLSVATYIDGATSAIQIRGTLNYIAA
jgi:hypothetical protein